MLARLLQKAPTYGHERIVVLLTKCGFDGVADSLLHALFV